jgi:predicted O-linked N-acetylglucosamine transferase (SPINDLY family)
MSSDLLQQATAYFRTGQPQAARECLRRATAQFPEIPEAHFEIGNVYRTAGDLPAAIAAYREALRLRPGYSDVLINLGIALANNGQRDEAGELWLTALRLDPNDVEALTNLATLHRSTGKIGEAIEYCWRALALDPTRALIVNALAGAYDQQGRLDDAIECYRRALELRPRSPHLHSNLLLELTYQQKLSPGEVFAEHRRWSRTFAEPLADQIRPHDNDRDPDRRLRVGYVSPDFRQHAVSFFLEPILQHHDREQVEVFCYDASARGDEVTARLQALGHTWRSIVGLRDDAAADLIRQDRIDLLVDLSGHTSGTRLLIFARKPAPIQVAFLGYLNTSGVPTIEYRITDAWADPPGMTDPYYTEKLIRLPRCAWCFQPHPESPAPVTESPCLRDGYVTFGSFNKLSKLSPAVLDAWAELLKAVANSRLMLKWSSLADESTRQRFVDEFGVRGIGPERLELVGRDASMADHLAAYGRIDLALDTFPYNGATTTCDALWMGVPTVTLAGGTHAGRIGVSLLHAIGLGEMVAQTSRKYIDIATALATDTPRLAELRRGMRNRVEDSPLREPVGITRAVEAEYRAMWRAWCRT